MRTRMFVSVFLAVVIILSAVSVHGSCRTKADFLAGVTEADFDRAVKYLTQGDAEALQTLLDSGRVIVMKPNIEVFLEDTKIFSGKVKIRPKGVAGLTLWTFTEAVDCN